MMTLTVFKLWCFLNFVLKELKISDFQKVSSQVKRNLFSFNRGSHRRRSVRKGVLRNFAKFTGKHLCQSLFVNKAAGLRPTSPSLFKKRLWHRGFPVNFVKFLRIPFLQNTSGRLLLIQYP